MAHVTADLVRLYAESDALALAALVARGEVTPAELTEVAIGLIETLDPTLNAVIYRAFDKARQRAAEPPGDGAFAGVPYLLKDINSSWTGSPLTAGLAYRKSYICQSDSEMVRRIKGAGFNLLGRTNVPENGWCIATEPRAYGPTLNPWNAAVTPGGSSGGSAVAVAARMVPIAEATDGGGSIRVPASCCGVVGLKPSRGRSTYGPQDVDIWYGSVSVFAVSRTVRDTAAFLDAVAGPITGDPYIAPAPERPWLAAIADRPRDLRIGYTLTTPWGPDFAPEVAAAVRDTAALLQQLGHRVELHPFAADLESAWHAYGRMNAVEIAQEFDRLAPIIGREVAESDLVAFNWSYLQRGRALSGIEHAAAIAAIRKANQQIQLELAGFDAFLTPTLTQTPRPVGYWDMNEPDADRYLAKWTDAAFMFAFNLSGLPALSMPAAWTPDDVPIGVQLVGRYGDEATILRLAAQLEEARPWIGRRPAICAGAA